MEKEKKYYVLCKNLNILVVKDADQEKNWDETEYQCIGEIFLNDEEIKRVQHSIIEFLKIQLFLQTGFAASKSD